MAAYKRTHPFCEPCLTLHRRRPTQIVDHRLAIHDGGPRRGGPYTAMCRSHHALKTHAERRARVS